MEREAQRIKDEKDRKDQESTATASRFGAAALEISGGTGGIWVPSRLRNGGSGSGMPTGWGSKMSTTQSKNVDTECENAFPDLATADAIIEKQKQEQPAYKVPTKTPVGGGGAYWGASSVPTTRPKLNLKKKSVVKEAETNEDEDTRKEYETFGTSQLREQSDLVISEPSPPTDDQTKKEPENLGIAETMPAPVSIKSNKKKKKKNLSTFKK